MKHLISIIVMTLSLFAQDIPSSFKDYTKYSLDIDIWSNLLYLSPKLSKSAKFVKNVYTDINTDGESKKALKIQFQNKIVRISLSQGDSDDPNFVFRFDNLANRVTVDCDDRLFLSEKGFIYSVNRTNELYTKYKKYRLSLNKITEIKQAFYKVSTKCETSTLTKLYSQKCQTGNLVASIPKGRIVKILLADSQDSCPNKLNQKEYLVETSFGLIGWVTSNSGYMRKVGKPLSCLMYEGD